MTTDTTSTAVLSETDGAASAALETGDVETVRLVNGLSCELPASSPLAKLLKSQRTWTGPDAKQRLKILNAAKSVADRKSTRQNSSHRSISRMPSSA